MNLSSRERFARLGQIRGINRVTSGSSAVIVLSLSPKREWPRTIDAMTALARRGLTVLEAKHAVEAVLERGRTIIKLPRVESEAVLLEELIGAGFNAALRVSPHAKHILRLLRGEARKLPRHRAQAHTVDQAKVARHLKKISYHSRHVTIKAQTAKERRPGALYR